MRLTGEEYLKPWIRPGMVPTQYRNGVLVNGCFDLLHSGHMNLLFAAEVLAKSQELPLVVALDSDRRIKEMKGEARPIDSFFTRYRKISWGFRDSKVSVCVVEIDSDEDMVMLMGSARPCYRVKDDTWDKGKSRFPLLNTVVLERLSDVSTSKIVERIKGGVL